MLNIVKMYQNGLQPKDVLQQLKVHASAYGREVANVCDFLLEDPRFLVWSGSGKEYQHHYGRGGLIKHTSEVVDLCVSTAKELELMNVDRDDIDWPELFMAALFHDCGKLYDYAPTEMYTIDNEKIYDYNIWHGTPHKRHIHHISRSGLMWSDAAKKSDVINAKYHDKVLHAILAHHGTREYGSPVAPKSRVAWLVHHCDCISARMYDADTWDCVKGNV